MNEIKQLTDFLVQFRNDRDWEQFHNPKDLALAISIEANELLESFLWKKPEEVDADKVKGELADVIVFTLFLAEKYKFDISQIVVDKMKRNAEKYPVAKSKANARKCDEF